MGMALNDNPRVADATLMIVAMLLMMSAGIFSGTITYLSKHWEEVLPYLPWLSVTPFGSAFAIALLYGDRQYGYRPWLPV